METHVTKHLDYLTVTHPTAAYNRLDEGGFFKGAFERVSDVPPNRFYEQAWLLRCGGRYDLGASSQGGKLELSGKPLAALRDDNPNDFGARDRISDNALLLKVLDFTRTWRVTRLDYAVTLYGKKASYDYPKPSDFRDAYNADCSITRHGLDSSHLDEKSRRKGHNGSTVYFGAKTSENRLCVYDKAAEQGYDPASYATRIELRVRGDQAKLLLLGILEQKSVHSACQAWMAERFKFPMPYWTEEVINGKEGVPFKGARKADSDFVRWLNQQVLPSVLSHVRTDEGAVRAFISEIYSHLDDIC